MKKLLWIVTKVEKIIAGGAIGLLATFVIADVLGREIFSEGIAWAQKASVYLMIWAGFIGASLTSSEEKHLRPEIADKIWGENKEVLFIRIRHLVTSIFSLFAAYYSYLYAFESYELGDKNPIVKIPLWIVQGVIPLSLVLIAFKSGLFTIFPELVPKKELGEH